jgi:hypothetical protein
MRLVEIRARIRPTAAAIIERNAAETGMTVEETARRLLEQFAAAFEPGTSCEIDETTEQELRRAVGLRLVDRNG